LIYFTTLFTITQEIFFPGIVGTYMNIIVGLVAIYFFCMLWWIAFQDSPWLTTIVIILAVIFTWISESNSDEDI
jgi:hypothetical protein